MRRDLSEPASASLTSRQWNRNVNSHSSTAKAKILFAIDDFSKNNYIRNIFISFYMKFLSITRFSSKNITITDLRGLSIFESACYKNSFLLCFMQAASCPPVCVARGQPEHTRGWTWLMYSRSDGLKYYLIFFSRWLAWPLLPVDGLATLRSQSSLWHLEGRPRLPWWLLGPGSFPFSLSTSGTFSALSWTPSENRWQYYISLRSYSPRSMNCFGQHIFLGAGTGLVSMFS